MQDKDITIKIKEILEFHPQAIPMQSWQKTEMDYRVKALSELILQSRNALIDELKEKFEQAVREVRFSGHDNTTLITHFRVSMFGTFQEALKTNDSGEGKE